MLIKRYTQPKRMFRFATHPRRARTRARGRPRPLGDSVTASPRGCLRLRPRANLGDTPIAACSQTASTLSPHVLREFERNKTPSSHRNQSSCRRCRWRCSKMFYYYYRQPAVVHQLLPALYLLFLMRQIRSGHAWERHTVHRHRPAARRFSLPPNGVGDLLKAI